MTTELLQKACAIATEVGQFQAEQRKTFNRENVEIKGSHDYVSYVDKESERMIVSALCELLPNAGFLTEENTTEQAATNKEYVWIIDPLDGTTNFIHDMGPWCVCIALRHREELIMGVVYEPTHNELFYAEKDGGAWLRLADGSIRQLCVSTIGDIDQALVCIGYPYNADAFRELCTSLTAQLYGHCASIRSLGSAETELCYIAAARLDIYIESYLHPWDVSAGAVILKEAGGTISDYHGENKLWPSGKEVLATNGLLHKAMIGEIQQARKQ